MAQLKTNRILFIAILVLIAATTLPYIIAASSSGNEYVFGGFLFNPLDGNSYFAKMRQGWDGGWRFTLPYTAEYSGEAYLFLFYILLGHLSRITGLSIPLTFHAARVICLTLMLISLYYFYKAVLVTKTQLRIAYLLAVFGSGFGWLAMMFGLYTADFWVAEAYPFLSAYSNPHFPLGLAILLWIFTIARKCESDNGWSISFGKSISIFVGSILLGVVMPFGVVVAAVVLGGLGIWRIAEGYRQNKHHKRSRLSEDVILSIIVCLGGGPILLYYFWVTHTNPLLAGWNMQNLTPAPPLWDFLISFMPVLVFGIPGIIHAVRYQFKSSYILIVWAVLGTLLMWVPFGLQRRFIFGLYIPFAGLASLGVVSLFKELKQKQFPILISILTLASLTNMIVILAAFKGINSLDSAIYITQGEFQAFDWLMKNIEEEAVILTGPDTGLFVPAYTGRRVIYGHPFETVNAEYQKKKVVDFIHHPNSENSLDILETSDYIFWGPREAGLALEDYSFDLPVIYVAQGVKIYEVNK